MILVSMKGTELLSTHISIKDGYITLGQFLKLSNCIASGGEAKFFLRENTVYINGQHEQRRGKKLYPGDIIEVVGWGKFEVELEQ